MADTGLFPDFCQPMFKKKMAIDLLNRNAALGQWSGGQQQGEVCISNMDSVLRSGQDYANGPSIYPPQLDLKVDNAPINNISVSPGVKIELEKSDLWQEFHQHVTEMVVTKPGRRMFPTLRFRVSGLDPAATYGVYIVFYLADNIRYKFQAGKWSANGQADASTISPSFATYQHPDSPAPGRMWISQPLSFHRIKLTNCPKAQGDMVLLGSMHKYQPRIIVAKLHDNYNGQPLQIVAEYAPLETQFVAVTAYQNSLITKLKVKHNPFAKGFRQNAFSPSSDSEIVDDSAKSMADEKRKSIDNAEIDQSIDCCPRKQSRNEKCPTPFMIGQVTSATESMMPLPNSGSLVNSPGQFPSMYFAAAEFARAAAAAAAASNAFYFQRPPMPPQRPLLMPPIPDFAFFNHRPPMLQSIANNRSPMIDFVNPIPISTPNTIPADMRAGVVWTNFPNPRGPVYGGGQSGLRYTMY